MKVIEYKTHEEIGNDRMKGLFNFGQSLVLRNDLIMFGVAYFDHDLKKPLQVMYTRVKVNEQTGEKEYYDSRSRPQTISSLEISLNEGVTKSLDNFKKATEKVIQSSKERKE